MAEGVDLRWMRALAGTLALIAAGWGPAAAQERAVYQWTDEAGVTHFSDSPPPAPPSEVRRHPLPQAPAYSDPRNEFFSVINQAQRMAEARREIERARREEIKARAELERARREEQRQAQQVPEPSYAGPGYVVPVHPRHFRRLPRTDLREYPYGHPAFSPHRGHGGKPSALSEPRGGRLKPAP